MENELMSICEYLGHFGKKGFEVTQAKREDDGSWTLTVKAIPQEATDDKND